MSVITNILGICTGVGLSSATSRNYLTRKVENINDVVLDNFPNVTLLMATLNEEWMIEKVLKSIKLQNICMTHPDKFEILVVDSDSEDNTVQIAKGYTDRIITMSERNLVLARTVGVNESRGDIIVFIDADTIYPVNWLNTMLKHYIRNPYVVAVSGQELNPEYGIERDIFEPIIITCGIKKSSAMVGHNSSCYKWAFNEINGFDVSFEYDVKSPRDTVMVLETNFAMKLSTVGKYVYDKQLIVYHYGLKRRNLYSKRKKLCNDDMKEEDRYLCNYWNEREKGIRF